MGSGARARLPGERFARRAIVRISHDLTSATATERYSGALGADQRIATTALA
jgi:hypothetical protein